jgi:hypothetical protein
VIQFMSDVADYVFGCRHKALSRVFTIGRRTYKVCCDCGAEFECSLRTMSAKRRGALGPLRGTSTRRSDSYGSCTGTASAV